MVVQIGWDSTEQKWAVWFDGNLEHENFDSVEVKGVDLSFVTQPNGGGLARVTSDNVFRNGSTLEIRK